MTTAELDFDYKSNMDKTVKLHLIHDYHEYYSLEFSVEEQGTGPISRLFHKVVTVWHAVQHYTSTITPSDKPGDGCCFNLHGRWSNRWFKVSTKEEGEQLINELRGKLKTVGDIYHAYIEPDEKQRQSDLDRYNEYVTKRDAVPNIIE